MPTTDSNFDPATTQQTFRLGTPDYLAPPLMAAIVSYMRSSAPGARLLMQPLSPDSDFASELADGRLDVVIGNWPQPPQHLRSKLLFTDETVCLVDRAHRCATHMRREDYLQGAHVVPLTYSVPAGGVVDMHLSALAMSRTPTVTVPYFSMAPQLLPGTDLIYTTSRHFAEHYAAILPLAIVTPPIAFPQMHFYQLWDASTEHAVGRLWFRSLLSAVVRTAKATQHTRTPGPKITMRQGDLS